MAEHSDTLVTVKQNSSLQRDSETRIEENEEEQNEKVFRPQQIIESTLEAVPENLLNIIENLHTIGGSPTNKYDLFISVLYVLMIETGFMPSNLIDFQCDSIDFHRERSLVFDRLPDNWKLQQTNTYHFEFILEAFPNRLCKMISYDNGANFIVNLSIVGLSPNICGQFRVARYVTNEANLQVPMKFRYLDELANLFKDRISNLGKNAILHAENVPTNTLQDMPTEILYNIFSYQSARDYLRLRRTCRRISGISKYFEHKLWKQYVKRDFPNAKLPEKITDKYWLVIYKNETEINQRVKLIRHLRFDLI